MAHDEVAPRADGRWSGKLTAHELPFDDDSFLELSPELRLELAQHWQLRASAERRVSDAFTIIHQTLFEDGAHVTLVALAERAVDDELRHTRLAHLVASRFAGVALDEPERLPITLPAHKGAGPALKRSLFVLGHCAFNECFASVVLEAALNESTGPLARGAVRELLSDEVDHARVGWAYLQTLDAKRKAAVGAWLLPLAIANVRMWRQSPRGATSSPALARHGAVTPDLVEDALRHALGEVLIPGFGQLGLPVEPLEEWLERGAPTR